MCPGIHHISEESDVGINRSLPVRILDRIMAEYCKVWTPCDFADLGKYVSGSKTFQQMVGSSELRRAARDHYD